MCVNDKLDTISIDTILGLYLDIDEIKRSCVFYIIFAHMTVFDQFFYSIFNHYKVKYKQKANAIAIGYTSILQIAILFLLGAFFTVFSVQMNMTVMSQTKAWTLFILIAIGIHFKNWIKYNGKGRKVLNAKLNKKKSPSHNIALLFVLPLASVLLGLVILQAL